METINIGIRDAKLHFSKLLKRVQQGGEVLLTDRGRLVAKIVPIDTQTLSLSDRIQRLEDQGIIQTISARRRTKPLPAPIPMPKISAQQYLQDDRDNEQQ